MNLDKYTLQEDRAISPVIGVILMVAITVILSAVIGLSVINIGSDTGDSAQAGVSIDETVEGTEVSLITSGTAESVNILVDGEKIEGAELQTVGDSVTVTSGENSNITIVGVSERGSENTIQSSTSPSNTVESDEESDEPRAVSGGTTSNTETSTVDTVEIEWFEFTGEFDEAGYELYETSDRENEIESGILLFGDTIDVSADEGNEVVILETGDEEEVGTHTVGNGSTMIEVDGVDVVEVRDRDSEE